MAWLTRSKWRFALGVLAAILCLPRAGTAQLFDDDTVAVDLELIIAIDVSSSVDLNEYHLQIQGLSAAFRHPAVIDAIEIAGENGIAVALVQWSDWTNQQLSIDWVHLRTADDAVAFAEEIRTSMRYGNGGSTGIAGALEFSARQFEINRFESPRRTIDVSGDGMANQGAQPRDLRDLIVGSGIIVNGLAILNDHALLHRYYQENVIGGMASFVLQANDYGDFAEAMLRKLIREIGGPPIASTGDTAPVQQADAATAPDDATRGSAGAAPATR